MHIRYIDSRDLDKLVGYESLRERHSVRRVRLRREDMTR